MKKYSVLITIFISSLSFIASLFSQIITNKTFGLSGGYADYILIVTIINFFSFYVHPYKESLVLSYASKNNLEEKSILISNSFISLFFLTIVSTFLFVSYLLYFKSFKNLNFSYIIILNLYLFLYNFSETYSYLAINIKKVLLYNNLKILITIICLANLYFFAKKIGINILYLNLLLSQFFILLITFYLIVKEKLKFHFSIKGIFTDKNFKKYLFSFIFTYFFSQIFPICEKYFIKDFSNELLVSYYIATNIINTLISVVTLIMSQFIYEKFINISDLYSKKIILTKTIFILFHIFSLINIYIYFNSKVIVEFLFYGDKFQINEVIKTAEILKNLSFILIPISLSSIIGRFLFSQLKTRFFIVVSFINLISGLIFLLFGKYNSNPYILIMSWFFANLFAFLISLFYLFKEIKFSIYTIKNNFILIIKNLIIIILSILILLLLNQFTFNLIFYKLLFTGLLFTITYFILFYFLFKNSKILII